MNKNFSRREFLGGAMSVVGIASLAACNGQGASATATTTASTTALTVDAVPAVAASVAAVGSTTTVVPHASGAPAQYIKTGPTNTNKVAITFHFDGKLPVVTALLDLLKAKGVHSTFFAIGDWITAHPEMAKRALADGHELGNHTKSHGAMMKMNRAKVRSEIEGGGQELVPFIGSIGRWFRPSGTDVPSQLILEEAGRAGYAVSVGYDIDSRDFKDVGGKTVISTVTSQLHAGAIISMHFGHQDTIDSLPAILDAIAAKGLTPVTVSELLG